MKRITMDYFVDIGLIITFAIAFVTGLIKFPGLLGKFGLHITDLPIGRISRFHDWAGLIMGLLVLVHIVLHWSFIVAMTKKLILKK